MQAEKLTDQDLLREVMNTVGKPDRLGESIRCVVSVSMLTKLGCKYSNTYWVFVLLVHNCYANR